VYSLEYTEFPEVFFMPQQDASLIMVAQRNWTFSLLLERNNGNKGNNDIQGQSCDNLTQGCPWFPFCNNMVQIQPVPIVATVSSNNDPASCKLPSS
jgi:hypothetical protein